MYSWALRGDKNHPSNTVCTLYGKTRPITMGRLFLIKYYVNLNSFEIEDNIDYPGKDLKQFKNISSAETCRTLL